MNVGRVVRGVRQRAVWPLPALLSWALAWAAFIGLRHIGSAPSLALLLATLTGVACATLGTTRWRRQFIAAGFPLSLLASDAAAGLPAWAWLAPLAVMALAYPVQAWRDAPLFPTPRDGLRGLDVVATLASGSRVLDAGCGVGDGLLALRAVYPAAQIEGIEWSRPWAVVARLRCPWARVQRGDLWAQDWSAFDLVYLFQRPESMGRAVEKALLELRAGAWLVSLGFPALGLEPHTVLRANSTRAVWIYRIEAQPTLPQ